MVTEKISKIDKLFGKKVWMQFAGKSLILIVLYVLLLPVLVSISGSVLESVGNSYYKNFQNDGSPHKVTISRINDRNDFNITTIFYDKVAEDGGNPIKNLEINIRNEVLNPIAVFFILFLAFPFGSQFKFKPFLISAGIIILFIGFKLFAMVYDNYNIPEYVLADLVFFLDYPVYFLNLALKSLGTSINYAFPAVLALISKYSYLETHFLSKNI